MGKRESIEVILLGLYITGAVLLLVTAYVLYVRRYRKRGVLKAVNDVVFTTSRYDVYNSPTSFLIELPGPSYINLLLLDKEEKPLTSLLEGDFEAGLHEVRFSPSEYGNGIYYLSLKTTHASILRRITIEHKS